MPKRLIIFLVFVILLVLANAGFYKWIDEEGKTHYSDSPPAGSSQVIEIEDSQRSVEIVRYQNEMESYCGSGSGGLEKQNAARSKLEKDWICIRARKHLEKLGNPDMHIPSSDIRKAESWMKYFCNE